MNKSDISKIPQQVGSRSKNKTSASWWPNAACTTPPWKSMTAFVFTCGEVCTMSCTHMQVFTTQQRTVRFFTMDSVLIFFLNNVPTVWAAIWYFHFSLLRLFFKQIISSFFFPFFFFLKESLGQAGKTAELRHKVKLTPHMPYCFLFSFQHSCGWKPVFRIPGGPSPWWWNIIFHTTQRGVRLCSLIYICIFRK